MTDALDHRAWLAQLQLLDSALPVGAFAHSYGLEAAVDTNAVRDATTLELHVRALLHGRWAPVDAVIAVAPWELRSGRIDESAFVAAVQVQHLSVPASRSREAQLAIGRRLLRLVPQLHADVDLRDLDLLVERGMPPLHPLIHGWAMCELGGDRERVALGWLHAAVAACVGSAVRLMALGQTDAQRIVARLSAELPDVWRTYADASVVDAAGFAPLADEWGMLQPRLDGKLFMS